MTILPFHFGSSRSAKLFGASSAFHQIGVVGDDANPDAEAGEHAVRVLVFGRIDLGDILRHVRLQKPLLLPDDEMCGVRRICDVNSVDIAAVFLTDTLEHALGPSALDAYGDAGKFRFEGFGDLFGERQVDRSVLDDFAFFFRRLDQLRRDRTRGRRGRHDPG